MVEAFSNTIARALTATPVDGLVSAYLFGSHAEGRAHRESDVDIGVLLEHASHPDRSARFETRLAMMALLGAALGRDDVDLVVLNDAPPLLGRHIVTSGVRVWCGNPQADHDFVRNVQLRAADLEPFLRRMRRIKLEGLAR